MLGNSCLLNVLFNIEISNLISEFFFHIKRNAILVNNFSIGSFFKYKETLANSLCASVVYKYCCPQTDCGSAYIGSTVRTLNTRVMEHCGLSNRTGNPLSSPSQSSIRDHANRCSVVPSPSEFKILASLPSQNDLRILESLYIFKEKPSLNEMTSAFPLKIVNH